MSQASLVEGKSAAQVAGPQQAHKPLVMVIDPNATARSVLSVALKRDGFDVVSTGSATEALLTLRRGGAPDVIVLEADLGMDDDGLSFCAQLRAETATSKVPVVLLAAANDPAAEAVANIVGVDDYLVKPAFARDVSALVQVEYARRSGARVVTFAASQMAPMHLLRALLSSPRSGHLLLARGRAEVSFSGGKVRRVRFDGRGGIDGLVRALALTDGAYMLAATPVSDAVDLQCGLKELVRDVFPRVERWKQAVLRGVPLDAHLVVDFVRLAQALPKMPDELNRVVQLFDGRRNVRQVLLDTPLNETLALEVLTRLYLMGVLTPFNEADKDTIVLKQAPRLFEPRSTEADELMRSLFEGTAEIRAEAGPAGEDVDWYTAPTGSQLLETSERDAGWEALPLSVAASDLTADLPDELAKQIEAFGTSLEPVPEKKTPTVGEQKLSLFSQGTDAPAGPTMEQAFQEATGDQAASVAVEAPRGFVLASGDAPVVAVTVHPPASPPAYERVAAQKVAAAGLKAPIALNAVYQDPSTALAEADDPQTRIETPWLNPVVQVKGTDAELEQHFFVAEPAEPTVQVAADAVPSDEAVPVVTRTAARSRASWLIVLGVFAVGVSLVVERLMLGDDVEAAVAPVLVAPKKVAPAPVVEPAAPAVDPAEVEQLIADGRKAYDEGRTKDAVASLEAALDLDASSVPAWLLLGLARYDSGNDPGAWEAVTMVQQLEPQNPRAYLLKATMELQANESENAKKSVAKYLELDPQGQFADEARALIERLH